MINLKQLETILLKANFLQDQYRSIKELETKISENEITISVMGQFKRGKSSLINYLISDDLLPAAVIPITTIITEIRYDNNLHAQVCYLDGTEEEINPANIDEFCSEEKNPGNSKKVKLLKIWTPGHPFGAGVVLADTPGVGSINANNTDISYQYIRQSEVILFLLSVDSPVSETERDFLLESKEFTQKFFFAINKSDLISKKDLLKFKEYCTETISKYLNTNVSIATISAKNGYGINELKSNIKRELKQNHSEFLEKSVEQKVEIIKSQAKAKLELQIHAASAPAEELKEKLTVIEEKQKQTANFANELQIISDHRSENLIKEIEKSLNKECEKINLEIKNQGNSLYQKYSGIKAADFEKIFENTLNDFLTIKLNEMNEKGLKDLETGYIKISEELKEKTTEVSLFLRDLLKDELGIEYPVKELEFNISEKSDFIMHIGFENPLMPDINTFNCLLPRKIANKRFFSRVMEQSEIDIERNRNNMLYNYRYKMQESLRTLCLTLINENNEIEEELKNINKQIKATLNMAENRKTEEINKVIEILQKLQ